MVTKYTVISIYLRVYALSNGIYRYIYIFIYAMYICKCKCTLIYFMITWQHSATEAEMAAKGYNSKKKIIIIQKQQQQRRQTNANKKAKMV